MFLCDMLHVWSRKSIVTGKVMNFRMYLSTLHLHFESLISYILLSQDKKKKKKLKGSK